MPIMEDAVFPPMYPYPITKFRTRKNIGKERYNMDRSDNIVDEHHIEIIRNMEGVLFTSKNESKKYKQPIR